MHFASKTDKFMHVDLHFITKSEDLLAFHNNLCLDVFIIDKTFLPSLSDFRPQKFTKYK